ncbi:hypothetical protein BKA62DRAFT_754466 [Auriculariales sp. MPI-PUGE-AT-0066]|nr:hypothetical protein BKA62DRAFT_754466 [Auriculariales sp. MPI-PUGE-AT-0066]
MDPPPATPANNNNPNAPAPAQPQAQDAQRRTGSVSGVLLFATLWFIFGATRNEDVLSRHQLSDSLQSLIYQQGNYSAFLKNETSNFTLIEYDHHLIPLMSHIVPPPTFRPGFGPAFYSNVTGFVNGDLSFFNLTIIPEEPLASLVEPLMRDWNYTEAAPRIGDWDWHQGRKVQFSVLENKPNNNATINMLHGKMDVKDETAGRTIVFTLEGLHFAQNGSFFGFAEAKGRHPDLRQLPALLPKSERNRTGQVIDIELTQRIDRLRTMIASGNTPEHDLEDTVVTSCPFVFHAQLRPAHATQGQMNLLEEEMEKPTGVSTIRRPPLLLDAVFVSPECGILLHMSGGKGLKSQHYWRKTTTFAGVGALAYMLLLVFTVREIARCNTHAMLSRVGRTTLLLQTCMDAFSFTAHLTFAIVADNKVSMPLICTGFLACMLLFFESQFNNSAWEVQSPERSAVAPPAAPTLTAPAQTTTEPVPRTGIAQGRAWANFTRIGDTLHRVATFLRDFYGLIWLIGGFIFVVWVLLDALTALSWLVRFAHFLFWVPQIVRNARRNTRMSLSWEYVLVVSVVRLFFAMYIFRCPENVIGHDLAPWAAYLPLGFALQLAVLFMQDRLGPSFFLPRSWNTADTYDYHPIIPQPDPEAPEQSLGDCAICMEPIIVPPPDSGAAAVLVKQSILPGATVKRPYALAPCHHLFHTQCLERWMDIKNICPQCRRPLPPM